MMSCSLWEKAGSCARRQSVKTTGGSPDGVGVVGCCELHPHIASKNDREMTRVFMTPSRITKCQLRRQKKATWPKPGQVPEMVEIQRLLVQFELYRGRGWITKPQNELA